MSRRQRQSGWGRRPVGGWWRPPAWDRASRSSTEPSSTSRCTIGEDLDASLAELQWINNGYLLTLASLILLGGSLGDRFGRRRLFVIGTVWFAIASLLCGIAPNAETLVVARLLQGIGGGLLTPGSLAMIQGAFVATTGRRRSEPGPASAGSPPPSARSSVARSSTSPRGAGSSWSTCRWRSSPSGSRSATSRESRSDARRASTCSAGWRRRPRRGHLRPHPVGRTGAVRRARGAGRASASSSSSPGTGSR